jgi:hypothetical protein
MDEHPIGIPEHVLAAAKAQHVAGPLAWLRWEQLDPECRAEYVARAEQAAGKLSQDRAGRQGEHNADRLHYPIIAAAALALLTGCADAPKQPAYRSSDSGGVMPGIAAQRLRGLGYFVPPPPIPRSFGVTDCRPVFGGGFHCDSW